MKRFLKRGTMFGILKKVRDVATMQNCEAVVNACGTGLLLLFFHRNQKRFKFVSKYFQIEQYCQVITAGYRAELSDSLVEAIDASKLKTFEKCDNSYTFALYVDKPKGGTCYVVYLPRSLKIWRTQERHQAELLRNQLNSLKLLVNILEKISSKFFEAEMEQLRDSVIKNPSFNDIHYAAACNFLRVIAGLCKNRPSIVNDVSIDGYYPLHIAVENDAKQAVQVLLSLGAHTAKQDCHSRNAVHYGAGNNPEVLKLLAGAHDFLDAIDVIDKDGLSPLCHAIRLAKAKCVEVLLDANCSNWSFPRWFFVGHGFYGCFITRFTEIVDLLLIRAPQFLVEEIDGSSTILHEKLESKLLHHILGDLRNVVNINVRNNLGQTPLYCAVARNLSQSFTLLTYGADLNIANYDGNTPLHVSSKNGDVDLVKLLLCFGALVEEWSWRNSFGCWQKQVLFFF
ncbi:Ankyrin repeats (3 copies) family protein [Brugia pahangi]